MPLIKASGKSKKAIQRAASANIKELMDHPKKGRTMKQAIAIGYNAARGR